jgi:hypothetical protein
MPSLVDECIHAGPISCSIATIAGSYMEGRCHFVDMEILMLFSPTLWLLDIWAGSGGVAYDEARTLEICTSGCARMSKTYHTLDSLLLS